MGPVITLRHTCRVCGSSRLESVFNLGLHYVNNFVEPGQAYNGVKCPIELVLCQECTLVQNPYTAPQELLYSGHYWYKSGTTETMRKALAELVNVACKQVNLFPGDVVLDIGSNDGTLLRNYVHSLTCVGIEPASNLSQEGSKGLDIFINDFWTYENYCKGWIENFSRDVLSNEGEAPKAKVITAIGMFYDLDDPNQFIADIAQALHPEGVFIAQLMCLQNMLNVCDFGNLAHEHLEFYTLKSLEYLLNKHGLELYDIEINDVNGQSYRLFIQHRSGPRSTNRTVVDQRLSEAFILYRLTKFKQETDLIKSRLLEFIKAGRAKGKKFWVYGASTKGNTIIQWLGLTDWEIVGAADKDPSKVGKVMIGSNIKIHSEEYMRRMEPDYCLVLPFAFREEFIKREANEEWRLNGGGFIFPFPTLEVI